MAATAALLAVPLIAMSSHAASAADPKPPKPKVVKIAAKAFPQLLDRPGTSADVLKLTQVAGAVWSVGGTAVTFKDKEKTTTVPVTGSVTVTVAAATPTDKNTFTLSGPTSLSYEPTNEARSFTAAQLSSLLTWVDLPGSKGDAVTLPKTSGVSWKIGEVTYDEAKFGKKTSLVVKLKGGEKVLPVLVGATLSGGGQPAEIAGVSSTETITHTAAQLAAAAVVGDNPFDRSKGFGKDASVETVKITGLPGVQWMIGSSEKAVTVKPDVVAYVKVDPSDLDASTTLQVTPVPAAGVTVPKTGDKVNPVLLDFADGDEAQELATPAAVVNDVSGTVADTLVLPGRRGITWYAAQPDAKGKLTYKALKVGKDGNAVYKVKHSKDGKPATVKYRAVADRGFLVDDGAVKTVTYTGAEASVAAPALASDAVTLTAAAPGVASWTVSATVGGKSVKSTYKPADLTAAGAVSISVPATAVELKVAKGYKKAD